MNPALVLAAINAGMNLIPTLLPMLEQYKKDGLITPEEQAQVLANYESLKKHADGQFSGPQWQVSTATDTPPEAPAV